MSYSLHCSESLRCSEEKLTMMIAVHCVFVSVSVLHAKMKFVMHEFWNLYSNGDDQLLIIIMSHQIRFLLSYRFYSYMVLDLATLCFIQYASYVGM